MNFFIYGEFNRRTYKTIFFRTITVYVQKCWNGAAYITRKWTCIFVLNIKLSAVNAQAIWMPKHYYSQKWLFSNSIFLQIHLLYQYVAFDSHFRSLRVSLLLDVKTCLLFSLQRRENSCVSWIKSIIITGLGIWGVRLTRTCLCTHLKH